MLRRAAILLLSALTLSLSIPAQTASQTPAPAYLQQAFFGINALQAWYTPDTGLYQTTGWWNSGNAITVLANYSRADGTNAFFPIFANTLAKGPLTNPGFTDAYFDDDGWWALAWIDVYDLTKKPEYLATATSIFNTMTGAWDNTCGGGIWWNTDRQYKNAIANELFLSVASHLAARATNATDRATYLGWAEREWAWFQGSGMINAQHLINDGLDTPTCKNNGQTVWSYNQGVILGGLTQLSALTGDKTMITTAQSIADATVATLTDKNGVLHDVCEPSCGADGVQFKGVFLRNLGDLQAVVHDPAYTAFANTNAESIWNTSRGPGYQFGQVWSGPFDAGNAGSQSSALDAFIAAATIEAQTPSGEPAPAFSLTASPATLSPTPTTPVQTTVSLVPLNGFTGSVHLTVTVLGGTPGDPAAPAGLEARLADTTLSGTAKTTLSVTTTGATPGGTYLVAVTGVSGAVSRIAYVTVTLPDFSLTAKSSTLYLDQSQDLADTLTVTPTNGFSDAVHLAISGLPADVTARLSPPTTETSSTLILHAAVLAPTTSGTPFTVTGVSGPTAHTVPSLAVAVSAAASTCGLGTPVNLKPDFNLTALRSDGSAFTDGGLDGLGSAFSSTLLGPSRVLNGYRFTFGPQNAPDAVTANGQTIALPAGRFNTLQLLGTAINGRQAAQPFTITYTDGTAAVVHQDLSDWFSPALNANETEAVAMPYRNTAIGTPQLVPFNLYGYTVPLDPTKTVRSLTLPTNHSVIVLAATLSTQFFGSEVDLASVYNADGLVTDGTAFPATGGLDGLGSAFSANLLKDTSASGSDLTVGSSRFHLAPANRQNVVFAAGQTIPLPLGYQRQLKLLGTGVGGNQIAQPITVHYADGTSDTITQSFSDWFSAAGFADETLALRTPYRDASDGSVGNTPFNVYLYTLNLNPRKQVESLTLPTNRNVVLLGITLAPPSLINVEPVLCNATLTAPPQEPAH